jgi:CRISPR-associated exonuclease Cas4
MDSPETVSPFSEDDLLPLSALQHLLFCERQCALIHVEGLWADNRLTVEGTHLHRKVDEGPDETRGDVRIARGVPLRSLRLGLIGKADVVEFRWRGQRPEPAHRSGAGMGAAPLAELREIVRHGTAECQPVEYKRGRPKRDRSDEVQLCAQALCLEEMLEVYIPAGALFYGATRRRQEVAFDAGLRSETEAAVARLRELIAAGTTPRARREPKCESCSMLHLCLPDALGPGRSAARYLEKSLASLVYAPDTDDSLPEPT